MLRTDHFHIFLAVEDSSRISFTVELIRTAQLLVPSHQVHLISDSSLNEDRRLRESLAGGEWIVRALRKGDAAAIAYAGCQLYCADPNAVMILVQTNSDFLTADILRGNFEQIASNAERPGALVSVGVAQPVVEQQANANPFTRIRDLPVCGIHAWSVYALMETYRNHAPVDFQVMNEMVRIWRRDPQLTRELCDKLTQTPIGSLLCKVQTGYPTRNIYLNVERDTGMCLARTAQGETPIHSRSG